MTSPYILIDTTLIGYPENKPWIKKRRKPSWVAAIYERDAVTVSPILVDVERAWQCNRIDTVMGLVNSGLPQLGISFIETELTLMELQAHFRRFVYILTEDGVELTLRFADCAVLSALSVHLTTEQWASLVAPLKSWKIHGRDGKLKPLTIPEPQSNLSFPLSLSDIQITALRDAFGADQLLANLRKMRPTGAPDYSTLEAYQCAEQARQIWLSSGHEENTELLLFARDVFDTEGRLLQHTGLKAVLQQTDPVARRKDLQRLTNQLNGVRK